jgi:hypothetical protein
MVDYIRDLRLAKWGSGVVLHASNPAPLMSALGQKRTLVNATPQKEFVITICCPLRAIIH